MKKSYIQRAQFLHDVAVKALNKLWSLLDERPCVCICRRLEQRLDFFGLHAFDHVFRESTSRDSLHHDEVLVCIACRKEDLPREDLHQDATNAPDVASLVPFLVFWLVFCTEDDLWSAELSGVDRSVAKVFFKDSISIVDDLDSLGSRDIELLVSELELLVASCRSKYDVFRLEG